MSSVWSEAARCFLSFACRVDSLSLCLSRGHPSLQGWLLDVTAGRIAILRRGELAGELIEVYEVEMPR